MPNPLAPVRCPRCHRWILAGADRCAWGCGWERTTESIPTVNLRGRINQTVAGGTKRQGGKRKG